jgi:hypothetical protein
VDLGISFVGLTLSSNGLSYKEVRKNNQADQGHQDYLRHGCPFIHLLKKTSETVSNCSLPASLKNFDIDTIY